MIEQEGRGLESDEIGMAVVLSTGLAEASVWVQVGVRVVDGGGRVEVERADPTTQPSCRPTNQPGTSRWYAPEMSTEVTGDGGSGPWSVTVPVCCVSMCVCVACVRKRMGVTTGRGIAVGGRGRVPKSAVDLCEMIGLDAYESGLYYRGLNRRAYQQRRVAYSCLSERGSSVFLLPKKGRRLAIGHSLEREAGVKLIELVL